MRFDLIRFEEKLKIWRLSNQLISIHSLCLFSHTKSIAMVDLNRPFTFRFTLGVHQYFFSTRSPITLYQIDLMGRLTFLVIFLTSSRLRQSSNHLFPLFKKRFSNYPERLDVDNCHLGANKLYNFSSTMRERTSRNRFIVYLHSIRATVKLSRLPFRAIENIYLETLTNCSTEQTKRGS